MAAPRQWTSLPWPRPRISLHLPSPRRLQPPLVCRGRIGRAHRCGGLRTLSSETKPGRHESGSPAAGTQNGRAARGGEDPKQSKNTSEPSPEKSPEKPPEKSKPALDPFDSAWEDTAETSISSFDDLPHRLFGFNQHMIINAELKEALRLMLREFRAPVVYCFAYGSGVFAQSGPGPGISEAEFRAVHPQPPEALVKAQKGNPKMIDLIFGVTHTQHWHSINMRQHRDHYSAVAHLGSAAVTRIQERWGAGVYFHPYVTVNGMLIKYGVTSIDNLVLDLSHWDNLYLAGRLQKPVKILRDHPRVRLANQHNLIAAVRTALLLLPEHFAERDLYAAIAGLSYLGDPRMSLPTESRSKISDIVSNNVGHFRRLYAPLVLTLPNLAYSAGSSVRIDDEAQIMDPDADHRMTQDMDPVKRGNMVRRLPSAFRGRLYFRYQKKFGVPAEEFAAMMRASADEDAGGAVRKRQGGEFEQRIARDGVDELKGVVRTVIRQTVKWPAATQSLKGPLTAGLARSLRYLREKIQKWRAGRKKEK